MSTQQTTLEKVKADPEHYKGWRDVVLVTNQRDVAELDWFCGKEGIDATIMVRFDQDTTFEYKRKHKST
jgi:hypothetical protein